MDLNKQSRRAAQFLNSTFFASGMIALAVGLSQIAHAEVSRKAAEARAIRELRVDAAADLVRYFGQYMQETQQCRAADLLGDAAPEVLQAALPGLHQNMGTTIGNTMSALERARVLLCTDDASCEAVHEIDVLIEQLGQIESTDEMEAFEEQMDNAYASAVRVLFTAALNGPTHGAD